jgi:hypothetical protein
VLSATLALTPGAAVGTGGVRAMALGSGVGYCVAVNGSGAFVVRIDTISMSVTGSLRLLGASSSTTVRCLCLLCAPHLCFF